MKIGETFEQDGKTYVTTKAMAMCVGCAFKYRDDNCIISPPCMAANPEKDVIYVEVVK